MNPSLSAVLPALLVRLPSGSRVTGSFGPSGGLRVEVAGLPPRSLLLLAVPGGVEARLLPDGLPVACAGTEAEIAEAIVEELLSSEPETET